MPNALRKPKAEVYGPVLPVWLRCKFPTLHIASVRMHADGERWFAARNTLEKPYCWTPTEPFTFGGRQYVRLYPCIAYATQNFGWVIQKGPHGMIIGRC